MLGKKIRLERIMNRDTGRSVVVPMDHGVTVGPIPGLIDMPRTVNAVAEGGANAVLGHVGLPIMGHRGYGKDVGLILHLSASTGLGPDPNHKVIVNKVERAIRLGADGVSIHVNIGSRNEADMLRDMGEVSDACERWGMPLMAMLYTRGSKIESEYDVEVVKHAARVGAELGADIIKVVYTGSVESFAEVVDGCKPIPVLIAGGEKVESDKGLLDMVHGAMQAGGKGVSIGRNAFQHRKPERITRAIAMIVHEGWSVDQGMAYLEAGE